jgi:polar amino acid transport system substrate-binding protein
MFRHPSWIALAGLALTFGAVPIPLQARETIVFDEADPPFMFVADGKLAGLYPALVAEAARRAGIEVELAGMPWKRALAEVDAGKVGVAGLYQDDERLKKYDFSNRLFGEALVVYVQAGKGFAFTGLDSLRGKTIGVIRGWSYGDDFAAAVKSGAITALEASGEAQNFIELANGRIDAVLSIRESGAASIAAGGWTTQVMALDPPFAADNPTYIAFAKANNKIAVLASLNRALAAMHADGKYDAIVASTWPH